MPRLDTARQEELEPKRIEYAAQMISGKGYEVTYKDSTKVQFEFKGNTITLFPYSGWHTGKGIKDGRGLQNLLKQI